MRFVQAFNPDLILGTSDGADEIHRLTEEKSNERKDLLVKFRCPSTFMIQEGLHVDAISEQQAHELTVDPKTCIPLNSSMNATVPNALYDRMSDIHDPSHTWVRVKFTLFSMLVSSSFFAQYNVMTFYTGVVVLAGASIRLALIFRTFMGWQLEITSPDPIIKIVEGIYMKRHECDLAGEEECYRMLQEIMRSLELLKLLSGSSLRGSIDPIYDKMTETDKKKYTALDELERRGFDISKMRDALNMKYDIPDEKTIKNNLVNTLQNRV